MEQSEFVTRRRKLAGCIGEGEVLLMFAGNSQRKTADEMYPFFTNRNFLYLTGVRQERTALIMTRREGEVKETLYVLVPDAEREVWTGRRFPFEEVSAMSGVADIRGESALEGDLHRLLTSGAYHSLWLCLDTLEPGQEEDLEHRWAKRIRDVYPGIRVRDIYPVISRMRRFKSAGELAAIRAGMEITNKGIRRMMRAVRPGMMEYQLEAEFLHELAMHGQRSPAFPSIVAAGQRNFYLHYPLPMSRIQEDDLVLTDVGAPFDDYCTDISRVFPANGKFSQKQAEIYRVAYEANREIMARVKPGVPFSMTNEVCREVSFEGLKKLGIISDMADIRRYVWHGVTHHVGLDTHDVGGYEDPMAPGMVFTVDAGIYVREWGIGLRIEDNVLVTEDGCENLSVMIPATIEEIEEAMCG